VISNSDEPAAKMRQEWDQRSRKNAYHYIASVRDEWPEDEFLLDGEREVRDLVDPLLSDAQFVPHDKRMLEVGCGVGRMTFALAKRFGTVEAIDISGEMIERAKELQARLGIGNVRFQVGNGKDLRAYPDESMDFAFSYIVFQHIPEIPIILNYVREFGRVLKKGGLFGFQLNGYRRLMLPFGYCLMWGTSGTRRLGKWKIRTRPHIRFGKLNSWRGVPISVSEVRDTCAAAGLSITQVLGIDTKSMWVNGRKG
jgi:ubiquinone/menaquinone biosynthesis C-methylase UbiE